MPAPIGLDADEVVNEFCRLFPIGDRRAARLMQAQADLIGHSLSYAEVGAVPTDGDRRTPVEAPPDPRRAKFTPRSCQPPSTPARRWDSRRRLLRC